MRMRRLTDDDAFSCFDVKKSGRFELETEIELVQFP